MAAFNVSDVSLGAKCPGSQSTSEYMVAPFLQRGCNRVVHPKADFPAHLIVGMQSLGTPVVTRKPSRMSLPANKLNDEEMRVNKWVNTGHQMCLVPTSATDKSTQTRYVVPFSPLFQIERIVDFKLAVSALPNQTKTNKADGGKTAETERVSTPAIDLEEETEQAALGAAEEFQKSNPTTYITKHQIIYAAVMWYWFQKTEFDELARQIKDKTAFIHKPFKPVDLGVFIAYFPAWVKFHELFRLGAYGHPIDFIHETYLNDKAASMDDFTVRGDGWEKKFDLLQKLAKPFAFLTPAMQEGSALGGPFLPTNGFSLTEIHQLMDLGSIWTIGSPVMPATTKTATGDSVSFQLLALPSHWKSEVPSSMCQQLPSPDDPNELLSGATLPVSIDSKSPWAEMSHKIDQRDGLGAIHIGLKIGSSENPGWTTHLPAKCGLLCSRGDSHQFGVFTGSMILEMYTESQASPVYRDADVLLRSRFMCSQPDYVTYGILPRIIGLEPENEVKWSSVQPKKMPFTVRDLPPTAIDTASSTKPDEPPPPKSTKADPKGTTPDPKGTKADPKGTKADPKGTKADPKGTKANPKGTKPTNRGIKPPANANQVEFYRNTCDTLAEQVEQYRTERDKVVSELVQMQQKYLPPPGDNSALAGHRTNIEEKTKEDLQHTCRDLKAMLMSETGKNEALEARVKRLVNQVTELKATAYANKMADYDLDVAKRALGRVEEKIEDAAVRLEAIQSHIATQVERVHQKEISDQVKDENLRLQRSLTQRISENNALESKIDEVERQNKELKIQLQEREYTIATLEDCNDTLQEGQFGVILDTIKEHMKKRDIAPANSQSAQNTLDGRNGVVPGRTVQNEVNNGTTLSRHILKRKMSMDLYNPVTKKMKSSSEIDLNMDSLSGKDKEKYMVLLHNEVLHVACKANLANPMDFDVRSDGIISLSKTALRKIDVNYKFKTYPEAVAQWRQQKGSELTEDLRRLMNKFNFFVAGHRSLLSLVQLLKQGEDITPGNLYEELTEVQDRTQGTVVQLDAVISTLDQRYRGSTDFRDAIAGAQRRATSLYSDYKTGRLIGAAYVAWKPLMEGEAKVARDVVDFIQPISRGYHALYRFREQIVERSKLPAEYAALDDVANPDNLDTEPPLSSALRAQLLDKNGTHPE
ncbi:hypothetical protein CEK26_005730 [Fusarium fujikuroi]|nr:hypothetical protein CEK26_005730 [Fusarium fujikuroi]